MVESRDIKISNNKEQEWALINIFPDIEYQEIKGFGGAFTEAASTTLDKLSADNRKKILELYFDREKGLGYNFGRVHINSCDFSLGNYTCVDEGDETLETFNISRDEKSLIPMIKEAMEYGEIEMFASPWSPPAYMKTNGKMNEGGKLKDEYKELWAEYFVKFIEKYKESGIDITTVSVQNEPKAVQRWDSCIYSAEEERDFVKNYLGKKMQDIGVKILFWDHNKERVIERAKVMLSDEEAAKYISGLAFHWYSGDHFEQLEMFNKLYPNKELVFSEGCYEYSLGAKETVQIGEKYAHDMIGNFNNYCNTFCDWNLLLDEKGGPNHVGNFCDSPIMADTVNDEIHIHDSYYYIGHFSKFVEKGAKRIGSSKWTPELDTVSFKNPDGTVVTVVLNMTNDEKEFSISINGEMFETKLEPHSIATYIFK
ncbi:MAG: glucosylceramidase [Ruminococcaceae bacterium]|nr:glucosylceramidase [Oscillospiraceae bacterium]